MDIGARIYSGDPGYEDGQPTYHDEDPVVPEGGGPVEAEPIKLARKKAKKKRAAKKKRGQK